MKNMDIINLNQISKIVLINTRKASHLYVVEKTTFKQWFLNLFRKDKVKTKCVANSLWLLHAEYTPLEEFLKEFEDIYGNEYRYNSSTETFFEKPHIVLWYSNDTSKETRYFDTEKDAKEAFDKLRAYAKQFDIPFIDFRYKL